MINVSIYQNRENDITGFKLLGHAEYADHGQDIVCAAVSVLVINTINSVETFTSDVFTYDADEETGMIEFHITSKPCNDSKILLKSMFLGLQGIQDSYGLDYLRFTSGE